MMTKDIEQQIADKIHSDDAVFEVVQCALEKACEELGVDFDDYLWSVKVEEN